MGDFHIFQIVQMVTKSRKKNLSWVFDRVLDPLSANLKKWSNTLKLECFDYFVGLALKGLKQCTKQSIPVFTNAITEKWHFASKN